MQYYWKQRKEYWGRCWSHEKTCCHLITNETYSYYWCVNWVVWNDSFINVLLNASKWVEKNHLKGNVRVFFMKESDEEITMLYCRKYLQTWEHKKRRKGRCFRLTKNKQKLTISRVNCSQQDDHIKWQLSVNKALWAGTMLDGWCGIVKIRLMINKPRYFFSNEKENVKTAESLKGENISLVEDRKFKEITV